MLTYFPLLTPVLNDAPPAPKYEHCATDMFFPVKVFEKCFVGPPTQLAFFLFKIFMQFFIKSGANLECPSTRILISPLAQFKALLNPTGTILALFLISFLSLIGPTFFLGHDLMLCLVFLILSFLQYP